MKNILSDALTIQNNSLSPGKRDRKLVVLRGVPLSCFSLAKVLKELEGNSLYPYDLKAVGDDLFVLLNRHQARLAVQMFGFGKKCAGLNKAKIFAFNSDKDPSKLFPNAGDKKPSKNDADIVFDSASDRASVKSNSSRRAAAFPPDANEKSLNWIDGWGSASEEGPLEAPTPVYNKRRKPTPSRNATKKGKSKASKRFERNGNITLCSEPKTKAKPRAPIFSSKGKSTNATFEAATIFPESTDKGPPTRHLMDKGTSTLPPPEAPSMKKSNLGGFNPYAKLSNNAEAKTPPPLGSPGAERPRHVLDRGAALPPPSRPSARLSNLGAFNPFGGVGSAAKKKSPVPKQSPTTISPRTSRDVSIFERQSFNNISFPRASGNSAPSLASTPPWTSQPPRIDENSSKYSETSYKYPEQQGLMYNTPMAGGGFRGSDSRTSMNSLRGKAPPRRGGLNGHYKWKNNEQPVYHFPPFSGARRDGGFRTQNHNSIFDHKVEPTWSQPTSLFKTASPFCNSYIGNSAQAHQKPFKFNPAAAEFNPNLSPENHSGGWGVKSELLPTAQQSNVH